MPSEHHRLSNASSLYDPISVDYSPSQANTAMGPDIDVCIIPKRELSIIYIIYIIFTIYLISMSFFRRLPITKNADSCQKVPKCRDLKLAKPELYIIPTRTSTLTKSVRVNRWRAKWSYPTILMTSSRIW